MSERLAAAWQIGSGIRAPRSTTRWRRSPGAPRRCSGGWSATGSRAPRFSGSNLGIVHEEVSAARRPPRCSRSCGRGRRGPRLVLPQEAARARAASLVELPGAAPFGRGDRAIPRASRGSRMARVRVRHGVADRADDAHRRDGDAGTLRCGATAGEGAVTLTIRDSGPGIPRTRSPRSSRRSSRPRPTAAHPASVCRSPPDRSRRTRAGSISVGVSPGHGATVQITFPEP